VSRKDRKNMKIQSAAASPKTVPTAADIVRTALEARSPDQASAINDMIVMVVGGRFVRYIGDTPNNLGPLSTPGPYDHKALEPMTNMDDGLLERLAREQYGDLSAVPFKTPQEAAVKLLGHLSHDEQAAMARVDIWPAVEPARRTKLVTLAYRDLGCGIAPDYVSESVFRIGSAHKEHNPWQQGAFGMGATTCYPNAKAIVLVTRRPPSLLAAGEEDVITVAVAEWEQHDKGRGCYYLVTEDTATNSSASPLTVPAAQVPEFEPGTYLALVGYESKGLSSGRNDRNSLEFIANTRLWRPVLPFTMQNHVARGDHAKTHKGRDRQFEENPRPDRQAFSDSIPFRIAGATRRLPVEVHYFEAGPSADVGGMRNFIAGGHSLMLLANGQCHKSLGSDELRRLADKLPRLCDRILVTVDLDEIPVDVRTSMLFTPDRVDLVKTGDAERLLDAIGAHLNGWSALRDLNNELVKKALTESHSDRSTRAIADRIRAELALAHGINLSDRRRGDDGENPPRPKWASHELWPDPTTLEGRTQICAVPGRTYSLHFHLNARPEFFSSGRGKLELECDHPRIGANELVAGTDLHNGIVRATLLVPDDVPPGEEGTITARVANWQRSTGGLGTDHIWRTKLKIVEAQKPQPKPPKPRRRRKGVSKGGQVAVLWRKSSYHEEWNASVPGDLDLIEATQLADTEPEYDGLRTLGSKPVPTVVVNEDYKPLRRYEAMRAKTRSKAARDEARDRYAVGFGVGMLVLDERNRKLRAKSKDVPDTLDERRAIARAALAMLPEFDKLLAEAGLEES
jgi:hypothetical protein